MHIIMLHKKSLEILAQYNYAALTSISEGAIDYHILTILYDFKPTYKLCMLGRSSKTI